MALHNSKRKLRFHLTERCANLVVQNKSVYASYAPRCTSEGIANLWLCILSGWTILVLHDFL
jgi:hypothetical protein